MQEFTSRYLWLISPNSAFLEVGVTLSNIRYVSRVKWSNPGKGVAPSPTPWFKLLRRGPSGHPRLHQLYFYWFIGLVGRMFANGPGNRGSITGRVIPKTLKMVLDNSLLNSQPTGRPRLHRQLYFTHCERRYGLTPSRRLGQTRAQPS